MWLNGVRAIPKRDNRGVVIGYGFEEPFTAGQKVTVAADSTAHIEFAVAVGRKRGRE
jgi:hypothetical protein